MRSRTVLLVVLCAGVATSPAVASGRVSLVITVKSVTVSSVHHEAAPKGTSKGDRYILRSQLRNVSRQFSKPAGAVVGRDSYTLTFTSATSWLMAGMTMLPGGTIRWSGQGRFRNDQLEGPLTVTGGSGAFAGARGTITGTSGATSINTYRLTLP
jgi:hypothetical protein